MDDDDPYRPPNAPPATAGGPAKLEIKKILAGAIVFVMEMRRPLAKALLIPFVLYTALEFFYLLEPSTAVTIGFVVLTIAIQTVFAVTTHRLILLGEGSVPEWGLNRWTMREWRFVGYMFLLVLLAFPMGILISIPFVGFGIAIAAIVWVTSRLSLVFPAIAVDRDVSVLLAWQRSRNHQIPLVVAVVVFPLALGIPAVLVSMLPMTAVLVGAFNSLATVFTNAALAICYREIERIEGSGMPGPIR